MKFFGGLLIAITVLGGLWFWLARDEPETTAFVQPVYETIEDAFARREEILRDVLEEPARVGGYLDVAAEILDNQRHLISDDRRWKFENLEVDASMLIFNLHARETNALIAMSPKDVSALFTQIAYRWICDAPETAAVWDIHARLFEIDGRMTMRGVVWQDDEELIAFMVEPVPCTSRRTLSAG